MAENAPYGSWVSPISAAKLASSAVRPDQLALEDGVVYWTEMRPTEGGRYVLVSNDGGANRSWTPDAFNVRSRVHEYGGGAFCIASGTAYFTNFLDQRIYHQTSADAEPEPLTAEPEATAAVRFADFRVDPAGHRLVGVRETHTSDAVVNEIVSVEIDSGRERVLVSGADFYGHPRLDPDGRRLAYVTWDHPNMPWDTTALFVVDLADGRVQGEARKVAGGKNESVIQPEWSPAGVLHFVSDRSNWWNIYRVEGDDVLAVCPMEAEFGTPMWVFSLSNYGFLSGDRIAALRTADGGDRLGIIRDGSFAEVDTPVRAAGYVNVRAEEDTVALLGGGPDMALGVHRIDLASDGFDTLEQGMEIDLDPGYLSVPESIEFPTAGGNSAHALYYAPKNARFTSDGELPPLLVHCHGGPTGHREALFDFELQFWTTRGFAVVDVNYGGSTGYGRRYRDRLKGNWGIVDVEDCVAAGRYLIDRKVVDPERVAIRGGSAGGYTTLASLAFTDFYAAGASHFGLGDLESFVGTTHKFESRYLDSLVGPYPEEAESYRARSAAPHADQISCPMILFQGLEDEVVPPSQAEQVVEALEAKGLPYAYLALEGEQHGFRKAESIERVANAELYFYARVFGFELPERVEGIEIHNL